MLNYPFDNLNSFNFDITGWPSGYYAIDFIYNGEVCHTLPYNVLEEPTPSCDSTLFCKLVESDGMEWLVSYCETLLDCEIGPMINWISADTNVPCPPCITGNFFQDDGCSTKSITGGRGEFSNTIDFGTNFSNLPVVFANSTQCIDQISMVDISNVSANNFEISSYVSSSTPISKNDIISYLAVPQGIINEENLKGIVHKTENVSRLKKHIHFENNFKSKPVVFATINQRNSTSRSTVRIDNVTSEGFDIYLQSEKGDNTSNLNESVSYMALEEGEGILNGKKFAVGRMSNVSSNGRNFTYPTTFSNNPITLTSVQSVNENDPVQVRFCSENNDGGFISLIEDDNLGTGVEHVEEEVGYFIIESSDDCSDNSIPFNDSNVVFRTSKLKKANVNVFPNPFLNEFKISIDYVLGSYSISLIDVVGKEIIAVSSRDNEQSLDLSSHPAGVYYLVVKGQNIDFKKKLIKM